MLNEITDRIEKLEHDHKQLKYQNLENNKLLEKIDEDIQRLNRLKFRIQNKVENEQNTNFKTAEIKENDVDDLKDTRRIKKEKKDKSLDIKNETENESGQWMDNSKSVLLKGVNQDQFRRYELAYDRVKDFYRQQHEK